MSETFATIRTRLRLVFVSLLMPFKLGFGGKDFAAVTDKVLLLRLLVQMYSCTMVQHVRVTTETFIAVRTLNRHGAGVNALMFDQSLSLYESLRTEATCVNSNVKVMFEME